MTNDAPIRFYFDYISPNAYFAWKQLPALAAKYGAAIEPVPVLFAGLLEASGLLGPAEVPAKSLWMSKNNLRKSLLLGLPLKPPAFHPFNPLLALRVSSLALGAAERMALIGGLFDAVWVRQLHVSDAAVVAQIAAEVGLDGAALLQAAQQPECKARLRAQTDDAIAQGVFGVPSMELGGEVFWGYDDFPYLELRLAGKDPIDGFDWQSWSRPQPSAMRPRVAAKPGD